MSTDPVNYRPVTIPSLPRFIIRADDLEDRLANPPDVTELAAAARTLAAITRTLASATGTFISSTGRRAANWTWSTLQQYGVLGGPIYDGLQILNRADLLTGPLAQVNREAMIASGANARNLVAGLSGLSEHGLLTQENFAVLIARSARATALATMLLYLATSDLLAGPSAQENRAALARVANTNLFSNALRYLYDGDNLTQENFNLLLANEANGFDLAMTLVSLSRANFWNNPMAPQIREALNAGGANAYSIARGVEILNNAGLVRDDLWAVQNLNLMIESGANALYIARAFVGLNAARLLMEPYRNDILASGVNAEHVARALVTLNEAHLLTEENYRAIQANRENAQHLAAALATLNEAHLLRDDLLTDPTAQANFDAVVAAGANALHFANTLVIIKANLLTETNRNRLRTSAGDAEAVADGISILSRMGLLTGHLAQANFDTLLATIEADTAVGFPSVLPRALNTLRTNGLMTGPWAQANFNMLVALPTRMRSSILLGTYHLEYRHILNQENFNLLFDQNSADELENLIPYGVPLPQPLTQESFDHFIQSLLEEKWNPNAQETRAFAARTTSRVDSLSTEKKI